MAGAYVVTVKQLEHAEDGGIAASGALRELGTPAVSSIPVTFQDVTYTVKSNADGTELQLLQGVTGHVLPGELTALMGPSGSGKSTLLDVLAGRKTVGRTEGSVLFAGHKGSTPFLRRYSSYVEQQDTLISNLTVQEMLLYTIELKVAASVPLAQKRERVDAVIRQLNLDGCRRTRIGNINRRGISGGQAKRVNVGLALVSSPRVLFLDEPTSGLDSYTANEVLKAVKSLTKEGIAICSTIHSPTAFCFGLFDSLTMLIRGRVIYCGPNGNNAPALFFQGRLSAEKSPVQQEHYNVAEWIVDLTTKADLEGRHAELADAYEASPVKEAAQARIEAVLAESHDSISPETLKELAVSRSTTNGFLFTIAILAKYRNWKDLRDPAYVIARVAQKIVFALLLMALYWKVGSSFKPSAVNTQVGIMLMWIVLPGYAAQTYVPTIFQERALFVRERADGLHRPLAYICSKLFSEAVLMVFLSLASSALVFYTIRLSGSFPFFWLNYLVTCLCGIALGYAVAAWSPTMEVANSVLPLYVTINLFFIGYLERPADLPNYLHWLEYICFLHYSFAGSMINEYSGTSHAGALSYNATPVLEFYSMADSNKWEQLGWLGVFFFVFMTFTWVALAYGKLQRR